jgi:hypothetical protein
MPPSTASRGPDAKDVDRTASEEVADLGGCRDYRVRSKRRGSSQAALLPTHNAVQPPHARQWPGRAEETKRAVELEVERLGDPITMAPVTLAVPRHGEQ